jgi:hypothetical protein
VGWAVWCALAIVRTSRSRWRHLAWLYPTATSLVVVSTANHYVLDVVAGALLAAACLALTSWHGSTTGLPRSPIAPPVSKSQPVRSAAGTRGEPASTGSSEPAPSDDFQPVR